MNHKKRMAYERAKRSRAIHLRERFVHFSGLAGGARLKYAYRQRRLKVDAPTLVAHVSQRLAWLLEDSPLCPRKMRRIRRHYGALMKHPPTDGCPHCVAWGYMLRYDKFPRPATLVSILLRQTEESE